MGRTPQCSRRTTPLPEQSVKPVLPLMVFTEQSLMVLNSTHEPFVKFCLLCPAAERNERVALVGVWHPASINPQHPSRNILLVALFAV